ncbi:MAG: DUF1553 domain-containing protein [Mariniblastus sp.]|nr:DUF1553 domain-containing protein [Mariniblastus sp.]
MSLTHPRRTCVCHLLLVAIWVAAGLPTAGGATRKQPQVTLHDVVPILLLRCAACHGRQQQDGGLDLRSRESMLKGGESGPVLAPGDPENSLILKRLVAEEMPPRKRLIEASVKPMTASEIQLLRAWIQAGAPETAEGLQKAEGKSPVSEQDRQFWAFQPPGDFPVPDVQHAQRSRNPIDAFILQKLEANQLSLSPEADRRTLIRRATFDLTGLPPDPVEVDTFLADRRTDAYEKMIERLLASRRYGERWGGYWLDRAGYADTEGERQQDLLRPQAYRYRDYVIRAFNADKPYDRFLLEQLAGDELADYENAAEITEEIYDNLVATGFLRMVPDPTWYNVTGFVPNRLDVVADAVDVLGSAVMGLTIKCARCHAHKFDPIPQQDYYSLLAIFKGAYDEHDWMKPNLQNPINNGSPGRHLYRYLRYVPAEELREWEASESKRKAEIATLKESLEERAALLKQQHFEERLAGIPEALRSDVRQAVETAADDRNEIQNYLSEKFSGSLLLTDEQLEKSDEDFKKTAEETRGEIESLKKNKSPEPMIRALWDRGEPSPTYLLGRGDYLMPGRLVEPAALSVLSTDKLDIKPPWPGAKKTGRRLALAKWLIRPDHPLTARVMVNTIWKHHFRHGIVKSVDNFGHIGIPPTHPELLDWLAREFIRCDWSIKEMHRLIMTSSTYRQMSRVTPAHEQLDLENDLLSRFPMKRMEAEVLWDTLLLISGSLDETPFGAANGVEVRPDGLVTAVGTEKGWRRSIYVEHNRKQNLTILECFDLPRPVPNCLERKLSTVAPQALHLLNNETIYQLMLAFADRVSRDAGADRTRQIDRIYQLALGRLPTPEENQLAAETLNQLQAEWGKTEADPDREALANLCHVLVNSAEFIYID